MSDMRSQEEPDDALVDLLVKQVSEGLSPAEQRALDVLDSGVASRYRRDLEHAAAAVTLAGIGAPSDLPASLRTKLEHQASLYMPPAGGSVLPFPQARQPQTRARSASAGWWAAAACLLLAVYAWVRPLPPAILGASTLPPVLAPAPAAQAPAPAPAAPPTPGVERAALMARSGSLKLNLGAGKDPAAAGLSGDVVWDPATQRGYIRIVGLAAIDPNAHQYQIWIFDGARDQRYPVDGGVFDMPAGGTEVLVPIRAAIAVRVAKAFAITVERPGGVVVSARDRVVALAQAG
jgi:hypothetical protein